MDTKQYKSGNRTGRKTKIAHDVRVRFHFFWLTLIALSFSLCLAAAAERQRFIPGQILVKPKARLSEADFASRIKGHGGSHRRTLRHIDVRVVNISEDTTEAVLAALRNDLDIEFAERDYVATATFVPNDTYVSSGDEWHLAKIQAPQAWDTTAGRANTIIAVIDSGINAAHPDFAGRVLPGYDFAWSDNDPADDFGHGTAVVGTVVAAGNNGVGVAGVAYGCMVLPVKVMGSSGSAPYSVVAQGIKYAVDHGARVINLSLAGDSPSSTLQDVINYAWSNNVVIVAAAGNNANTVPQYPAACDHVVAVAATASDDSRASFSSYGSFVALAAPGDNIWTTQRDLQYGAWRGTSFASPVVAGVAALIVSANPSLSNTRIVEILKQTVDDVGAAGYDTTFGCGRVNAFRAVSAAAAEPGGELPPATPPVVNLISPTNAAEFVLGANVSLAAAASASRNSGLVTSVEFFANGIKLASCSAPPFTLDWNPAQAGSFSLKAVTADKQGLRATSAPVTIHVSKPPSEAVTNLFLATKGGYAGLIADTNGVMPNSSGYFTLKVTTRGAFSGKLLVAGKGYGFSGQFSLAGDATVSVRRNSLGPLTTTLHLDLTSGTDQVAGYVTDGNWTSELSGDRNVFNARSNPAQQAGVRSFFLERSTDSTTAATGASKISGSGLTRVRGKLNDGRALNVASTLAKNGDCPFYLSLSRGSEVVVGWLNFPAGPTPTANGTAFWVKTGTNGFAVTLQAASAP